MMSASFEKVKPLSSLLTPEEKAEFQGYEFPFENLAFEGGGSKGMAYVGMIRVFEELDLMKNMKRFAGTSAGSAAATSLAIGMDSYEIQELLDGDFTRNVYDGKWGLLGRMVGMVRTLGAHPGKRLEKWFADGVYKKTGDRNYTFRQLYQDRGVELCAVSVNLNLMDAVYFHVKTMPDMPISLAGRASASIPGVLQPVKYHEDLYVDGGLLCNFPIHVYDGWFLSMDPTDSFFAQFGSLVGRCDEWDPSERFSTFNEKTVGVLLYSSAERDVMKQSLDHRVAVYGKEEIAFPDSKLCRKIKKKKERHSQATEGMHQAMDNFMKILKDSDTDQNGIISREEFRNALGKKNDNVTLSADDVKLLFECENDPDAIFDVVDKDNNGQIDYQEVVEQAAKRGINLLQTMNGYERCEIKGVTDLFATMADTLLLNVMRITTRNTDYSRTIGINTKYLESFDWNSERADKNFLIQCGKQATLSFLREYIATKNPPRKSTPGEDASATK
ncbi:uncharacterized protein LOC119739137 [Patiria miniata]|uniref:Uncharacterized protein n=1 Tax=Patiria miniata TaxID=46514 RepID=A0A914B1V4_PATMI|nr:uncharacterized protein LOC119739137 [Patiria miniata]